ncbi:hypothetical protein BQ8482_490013 [Mesorhizobium delmotii]|uniref:Uncharacterized protein n=1 Tax=Mesorhizobium delmotii TaxID=1631247 RepID=A0A2P9AU27_9HYPH|nr:hypothetical protein BQ8482_490013 [Mesorhizobium delmotii]
MASATQVSPRACVYARVYRGFEISTDRVGHLWAPFLSPCRFIPFHEGRINASRANYKRFDANKHSPAESPARERVCPAFRLIQGLATEQIRVRAQVQMLHLRPLAFTQLRLNLRRSCEGR